METYKDLINEWGAILMSEDLILNYKTVAKWRERNSIPVQYFEDIVEKAKKRKIKITLKQLVKMASKE